MCKITDRNARWLYTCSHSVDFDEPQFIIKLKCKRVDGGGGDGSGDGCSCHFCRQICLSLAHIFINSNKNHRNKRGRKKKHAYAPHSIADSSLRCTHFWKFSRIDFIAFHFYVRFNNMPVTLFNSFDFMEKERTELDIYSLVVDAAASPKQRKNRR